VLLQMTGEATHGSGCTWSQSWWSDHWIHHKHHFDRIEFQCNTVVQLAAQPPDVQSSCPIEHLLQTIQSVHPPNGGVAAHPHFEGLEPIRRDDISKNGSLDEKKLQKAVRKLKFFLHPDKLPRDLSEAQVFVCVIHWKIANDAWEEPKRPRKNWTGQNGSQVCSRL